MSNFSLSRKIEKVLPETVKVNGSIFPVHANFRNVLRILRMLADDSVFEPQKPVLLAKWFFGDIAPTEAKKHFEMYITALARDGSGGSRAREIEKEKPPRFDFEFDAEEIYSSFLSQYEIDLLRVPFLHWYEFLVLLGGLGEDTAFRRKLSIRFLDTKDLKGETLSKAKKAKEAVQIPTKQSREAVRHIREIEAVLLGDGDLSGVL